LIAGVVPLDSPVVSAEWLVAHLENPAMVIVDCRFSLMQPELGHEQYLQGHLPGAFYLDLNQDLSSPVQRHGGRHPLPDFHMLANKLSRMGVTPETLLVAYDDQRFAFAARLWWLLRFMGHERVAVLDGGFSAYQTAGHPVTTEIPAPRAGGFTPSLRPELATTLSEVQYRSPDAVLIDSREADRYHGEREPIDPIAGHIPGAINYPWPDVTDEVGKMRSPEFLRHYWSDIAENPETIFYCGSGVTACVNLLSMGAAGLENGKLYVGGWSDWCSYPLDSTWHIST
jgi:thiosulfate/3-mercaptopyruvate sulfurtransferase